MSPARIIILLVALVAGVGAAMLIRKPSQGPAPVARVEAAPTVPVLVAAADIPVGNVVAAADLRWLEWPLASVPAGVVRKDEAPEAEHELTGQVVRYGMLASEPIRREKLIKTDGTGFLSAVLPSGMRAVAISTDSRGANTAGGFILPNDRVDVIVTMKGPAAEGDGEAFLSETILRNLRVLAIGQNVQERNGEKVVIGETATLEVDPGQAETLFRSQKMGTLSLALRSLKDAGQIAAPGVATEGALTIVKYGVTMRSANQ
ncbi:MAG TPA: Flp pilus assembly protein CpaB [Bosea sp. (in: a-proteobacteria)]|jgi:pilus assembly protein CpaB|uniref:Flp pilus assembly protein CpaB n=1 Tax=Bosea sp. (in: a-proteobacteria) TaxID=1871050 RepID=UPI002E0F462C|nr:Flp pilus assembly protein CpaB [Bosea sp. (in: a-proteobacteria)]